MHLLDDSPHNLIINHKETDLDKLSPFVHRKFNSDDCIQFIKSLHHIYLKYNGLEAVFSKHAEANSLQNSISKFKTTFFEVDHLQRTQKHISDPSKNSAAKRINIFISLISAA